jgi:hypothetical protein
MICHQNRKEHMDLLLTPVLASGLYIGSGLGLLIVIVVVVMLLRR